jgi:hypothetical protein
MNKSIASAVVIAGFYQQGAAQIAVLLIISNKEPAVKNINSERMSGAAGKFILEG